MRGHHLKCRCELVEQRIAYRVHRPMSQSQGGYRAVECQRRAFLLRGCGFSVHVEAVAKALDRPIVVTDDFARAYDDPLISLGRHQLRGLAMPRELYVPAAGGADDPP